VIGVLNTGLGVMMAGRKSDQEVGSRSEINKNNVMGVAFGDLADEDQRWIKEEMCHELEEVDATKMCEMLACYQKTRSGVVQKSDTIKASSSMVNPSSLTPEDRPCSFSRRVGSKQV
jgi:hypothetical protein